MHTSAEHVFTRRQGLLGTVGALGALGLSGCADAQVTSAAPSSSATPAVLDLEVGRDAVVRTSVTTAWLKPDESRPATDDPATQQDAAPQEWLSRMDWAQQQWLLGKTDTQAALGSRVTVRDLSGSWARVSFADQPAPNEFQHQTSWVPAAHLVRDTGFLGALENRHEFVRVSANKVSLSSDRALSTPQTLIPFGTRLPLLEEAGDAVHVQVPGQREGWLPAASVVKGEPSLGTAQQVIDTAKTFLGVPYLWAGMSPFGFDCSGFTYTVFRSHGILLPRDAGPQLNASGLPKVAASDLAPGDLLFYSLVPGGPRIRHVALYLGKGYGIHSPAVGRKVSIAPLKQINAKGDYAGAVRPRYAQA